MKDLEKGLTLKEDMAKAIIAYFNNKDIPMSYLSIDSCCVNWQQVDGKLLTTVSIGAEVLV